MLCCCGGLAVQVRLHLCFDTCVVCLGGRVVGGGAGGVGGIAGPGGASEVTAGGAGVTRSTK